MPRLPAILLLVLLRMASSVHAQDEMVSGDQDVLNIENEPREAGGNDDPNVTMEPTLSPQLLFLIEASKLQTFQVGLKIQRYVLPVIIFLGVIGNSLSLAVMLRPHNRRISCCVYMAGLAVSDSGSLLVMIPLWVITDGYPTPWTTESCITWVYFVYLTTASSAFLLVVLTADRCLAIRWPLKARAWCTASKARKMLFVTWGLVGVVYIPLALTSRVVEGNVCAVFIVKEMWSVVLSYVNLILIPGIPFVLILGMNIIIIKTVRSSGKVETKFKEEVSLEDEEDVQNSVRNRQLTIMLVVVSIAYLTIMLPVSIRVLVYSFYDYTLTTERYALFVMFYNVANNLLFLNNAINFYLYCITGAKFREDLRNLFCKKGNR